jgi:hypothetical protein
VARGSKKLVATLVALLLAVAFIACGGGDDSTSETAATQAQPQGGQSSKDSSNRSASKKGAPDNSQGKGSQGQSGSGDAADFTPKQHRDSGGGSDQFIVKGGDNSVQEFGQEAGGSEFEAAATALHNFLDARAQGNWDAACQYLAKQVTESFEKLASQAKSIDETSCGAILENLVNPAAKQTMVEEAAKADIGSMRTEGDQAFLIYTAGDKTFFSMPMTDEGGSWKVASLSGYPLN